MSVYEGSLRQIFTTATESVFPTTRLKALLTYDACKGVLTVDEKRRYVISPSRGCHVVGFGKAVLGMVAELQRILGSVIKSGVISVPVGIIDSLRKSGQENQLPDTSINSLTVLEGAPNNIPDKEAARAASMIGQLAKSLDSPDDLLFVLVSGGGSALLPAPIQPITLEEIAQLTSDLSKAGATIRELNTVRIQLSALKGGKLATLAFPARVVALILSDIIDDPLELISSGPTVQQQNTNNAAVGDILQKYATTLPTSIKTVLMKADQKSVVNDFGHVQNVLIGSNSVSLARAAHEAQSREYSAVTLTRSLVGEASSVGYLLAKLAHLICTDENDAIAACLHSLYTDPDLCEDILERKKDIDSRPLCLIMGGETVVKVRGKGKGGRNQEMVLAAMLKFQELEPVRYKVAFLSAGTDGIDGPTDVAGAVASLSENSFDVDSARRCLDTNDSYSFFVGFNDGKHFIKTGHTGTNVMDIQMLCIGN